MRNQAGRGRLVLVVLVTCAALLVSASGASALTGKPVAIGVSSSDSQPALAVDANGTAYVAWTTSVPATDSNNTITVCTVAPGASACSQNETLTPPGNPDIGQLSLSIDGSTVILTSQDFDGGSVQADNDVNEWTATDGSDTFTPVDMGESVGETDSYAPQNTVVLPVAAGSPTAIGHGYGGVLYGSETFDVVSPYTAPPECSEASCASPDPDLATFTQSSNYLGTQSAAQYASQDGTNPGVIGVFNGPVSACPAGSPVNSGTSFVYGSGLQSSTHSYALSPGTAASAWSATLANLACGDSFPAVAGGPSGFGVAAADESAKSEVYLPFDAANGTFDKPAVTITSAEDGTNTSVSQDGTGGIYVTYLNGNSVYPGPLRFAYSANGGASWTGPATLNNTGANVQTAASAVGSGGQGWLNWLSSIGSGSYTVDIQQFVKADAVPPATAVATSQTAGTDKGASISVPFGTTGETDQATISGVNASTATGTVSYELFSSASCTAASEVFDGGTQTVTNGVAAASNAVSAQLAVGTYYWAAYYSGDDENAPSVSGCGNEVLTVAAVGGPPGVGGSGTSSGSTITLTVTCPSACTVTITVTVPSASAAADVATAARSRLHTLTLAHGTFKLPKGETKTLTLHLTKAGKKLFRRHHGRLKARVSVGEKLSGRSFTTTKTVTFHPAKRSVKKKHRK